MGTSFALKLFGALVALPLSLFSCVFSGPKVSLSPVLVVLSFSGFRLASFSVLDCYFQSVLLWRVPVVSKNVSILVFTILKLSLLYFRSLLVFFALANLAEIVLGFAFVARFFCLRSFSFRSWNISTIEVKYMLRESLPLLISTFAIIVYTRIDLIMLYTLKKIFRRQTNGSKGKKQSFRR